MQTVPRSQPVIDECLPLIKAMAKGRCAVAIGGSHGKGTFDHRSDVDFRLYCDTTVGAPGASTSTTAGCGQSTRITRNWRPAERAPGAPETVWALWGYVLLTDLTNHMIIDDPHGLVERTDVVFLASIAARLVHDMMQVLFAINKTYYVGDGNNLHYVSTFPLQPSEFAERVTAILYPTQAKDVLTTQYEAILGLIDDIAPWWPRRIQTLDAPDPHLSYVPRMTARENVLKAVRFDRPDYIPMTVHINPACWHHYDQHVLQTLIESHPVLFPGFKRSETVTPPYALNQRQREPYTDPWGCVWETTDNGITGSVRRHPLEDWNRFAEYEAPDPAKTDGTNPADWPRIHARVDQQRRHGELVRGGLTHGHTFLRLQDIRGFENLTFDMADEEPKLSALIEMVENFNHQYVIRWLALEPDMMSYPEDLGMQIGPMLSPQSFRKYIKPVYQRLMAPARDRGCIVHMHSDGDIRTLADDLIDGGVEVINLQDLVNGLDWIAGRTCIELDIDRQFITARGTPEQIDDLIMEEVDRLGSKNGGLMMIYGLYPGVPLENIEALMDAMEKYATHYS